MTDANGLLFDELQVLLDALVGDGVAVDKVQVGVHQRQQAGEVLALAVEDLAHRHLLVRILVAQIQGLQCSCVGEGYIRCKKLCTIISCIVQNKLNKNYKNKTHTHIHTVKVF